MKKTFVIVIVQLLITTCFAVEKHPPGGWKAGVAKTVITPGRSMWMAGYANRTHPSEGRIHDLWAKALALEDAEGHQVLMITMDICSFSKDLSDRIRDGLKQKYDLSRSQIILNCSHTHSGPVVGNSLANIYPLDSSQLLIVKEYTENFEKQILAVAENALDAMEPAELYVENGMARFQVNRRNNNESSLLLLPELRGPDDYSVPVIKVLNSSGRVKAIVFGYACHNTVLNGYEWSGDYAGFAQLEVENLFPGATAMFFQGAGADLNPLPRRTVPLARQYGQELAYAVEKTMSDAMRPLSGTITSAYSEVELHLNPPPERKELERLSRDSSLWYIQNAARRLLKQIERGDTIRKSYSYPVQVWRLGEQSIFALGGELVVEYAIEIKKIFGVNTFVMGYSNDVMSYIPSLTILRESNDKGAENVFYDPIDRRSTEYEGGLNSQLEYGMPATWAADIELLILGAVRRTAAEANVQMSVYK